MANRYYDAVAFTLEKNVVTLSANVSFGATGIPTLNTLASKGICNFAVDALAFNANSVGSSATLSSVTSFSGLYNGMTLSGSLGTGTISSITAGSRLITLTSGTGITTTNGALVNATGGRFRVQFGQQAAKRLDTYNKLMGFQYSWDYSSASTSGGALIQAVAPNAPETFIVQNNTQVRTIPQTLTSGSTDASLVIQTGNYLGGAGQNFTAANPVAGSILRLVFVFGNSTAI